MNKVLEVIYSTFKGAKQFILLICCSDQNTKLAATPVMDSIEESQNPSLRMASGESLDLTPEEMW